MKKHCILIILLGLWGMGGEALAQSETAVFTGKAVRSFPPVPRKELINEALRDALLKASGIAGLDQAKVKPILLPPKKAVISTDSNEEATEETIAPLTLVSSYQIESETQSQLVLEVKIDLGRLRSVLEEKIMDVETGANGGITPSQSAKGISIKILPDFDSWVIQHSRGALNLARFQSLIEIDLKKRGYEILPPSALLNTHFYWKASKGDFSSLNTMLTPSQGGAPHANSFFPELTLIVRTRIEHSSDPDQLKEMIHSELNVVLVDLKVKKVLAYQTHIGPVQEFEDQGDIESSILRGWNQWSKRLASFFNLAELKRRGGKSEKRDILFEVDRLNSYSQLVGLEEAIQNRIKSLEPGFFDLDAIKFSKLGQGRATFKIRTHLKEGILAKRLEDLTSVGIPIQVYEFSSGVMRAHYLSTTPGVQP